MDPLGRLWPRRGAGSIGLEYESVKKDGEKLEADMEAAGGAHTSEVNLRIALYLDDKAEELEDSAAEAAGQFSMAIEMLRSSIATFKKHRRDTGELQQRLTETEQQRDASMKSFEENIGRLREEAIALRA